MFGFSKKVITDDVRIQRLLTRSVEDVFVRESLERKLKSRQPLRVKLGFDPTGPRIHIGRAIVLRKLRDFQRLGHTAVFVVGDFTAHVGDPSDKLEKRPMLTESEIRKNLETYKMQVGKILDLGDAEFHYNSRWLSKLNFGEIAKLAESFSVQQMSARRNFKERIERSQEISLREFLYPLMQGYDSVQVKADVEIGGVDQLFNLKAGRIIQGQYGQREQDVLTTAMLPGTDGRKMSTSWGNIIAITDSPDDMFGKVMSIKDELISKYFLLCTDVTETDIARISEGMREEQLNPRDAKIRLATEIIALYHGVKAAKFAAETFEKTFAKGGVPENVPTIMVQALTPLVDVLQNAGVISSKSEFRRLVSEGAISKIGSGEKITDTNYKITAPTDIRVGKHRFVRITCTGQ